MSRPSKVWEIVRPSVPKYGGNKKPRLAPLGSSRGFTIFVWFPSLGLQNHFPPRHMPRGSRWCCWTTNVCHPASMATIGAPVPPQPHWSVGEVLGTSPLLNKLVEALLASLWVTRKDGWGLLLELRYGQGLHAFLWHLASYVDPVTGMERLDLLGFDQDEILDLLYLFFSILVGSYSMDWMLLEFIG